MNKKKLAYKIVIAALLVLGYLNYFGDEKKVEKKDEVIETTGAVYDTDGYHIEADKQKDFLKTDETMFEKAKAILNGMTLTGDNALVDAGKNLLLKTNIFGKSLNGWEFETQEAKYNKEKGEVESNVGVKAINKEEGIEISGKNFKSDTKMENVFLSGDVKFKTKNVTLSAEDAKYNDQDKIVNIEGNAFLSGTDFGDGSGILSGDFKGLKYDTKTNLLTTSNSFMMDYNGIKLYGDDLVLNDKTEAFKISKNVYILADGYKINMESITSDGGDNINFNGKIDGTNGIYSFKGNDGVYNKITKKFVVKGDVEGSDTSGGKLLADMAIYSTDTKELELIGDKNIEYTSLENKILTKNLIYLTETGELYLKDGYTYFSEKYESKGQSFFYNKNTGKGYVIKGNIKNLLDNQYASGDRVDFDREEDSYLVQGNAYFEDSDYIFESQKIDYLGKKGYVYLPEKYTLKRRKDKDTFEGLKGEYNLTTEVFKSFGAFKYVGKDNIIEGVNLDFNQKTGIGNVEKDLVAFDKKGETKIVSSTGEFKQNEFVKVKDKLVLTSGDIVANANSADYEIKEGKVFIPGEITFEDTVKKSSGKMYNGVYQTDKKILTGENFTGKDMKNALKSDIIKYFTNEGNIILEKNAEIKDEKSTIKGNQLEYNKNTEIAKSPKPFVIKYNEYDIYGQNGTLDKKTSHLTGKDVLIKSKLNEEFKGDSVDGTLDNMNLDFIGNVSGRIYQDGVPVNFKGDFVRAYFKKDNDGKNRIQRVEIRKNAVIEKEGTTLYSDYLEIQPEKKLVFGKDNTKAVLKDKDGTVTTVTSNMMNGNLNTEVIDLVGKVVIVRKSKDKTLNATSTKAKIKNKENLVELRNNVYVDDGESIITADEADYNTKTNKVKARGNVFVDYKANESRNVIDINKVNSGYNKILKK
ncbi:LPS export ABC transporter periplasmic protein LptC [Candidatus Cetobacterium colombiensis]|uniref:LPS export ABC transporter periplasmic protein LptC n=1 Tax=Candidatus Cetobacterium colombiensis TaxID=3073100 RepID=A0ABU4WB19_9FUSO|nr:LPS export ABC transporter periplasmic protein LptC [Candidatus Cetobacterium colombiensis]MDX8336350.1 LPS export ABC transporter periplasmic protein LptC [Candidatus Cetobacterium colombiensis]